jgi:hypothetical protein
VPSLLASSGVDHAPRLRRHPTPFPSPFQVVVAVVSHAAYTLTVQADAGASAPPVSGGGPPAPPPLPGGGWPPTWQPPTINNLI